MAILQAAADDWKEKWGHWKQYCYEQHHAYVNPIFYNTSAEWLR